MPNNCLTSKFLTVLLFSTTLLFRIARNHGRDARVTTAAFSCFADKHGDLIYKEMYGAKIILEDRKSFRIPVEFVKSEFIGKSIRNHTVTVFFDAGFSCHLGLMILLFTCDKLIKSQSFT